MDDLKVLKKLERLRITNHGDIDVEVGDGSGSEQGQMLFDPFSDAQVALFAASPRAEHDTASWTPAWLVQ